MSKRVLFCSLSLIICSPLLMNISPLTKFALLVSGLDVITLGDITHSFCNRTNRVEVNEYT